MTPGPLEQLPSRCIPVRDWENDTWVMALVDGDFDGEYFAQIRWYVNRGGYVVSHGESREGKRTPASLYLHHLVLPPRNKYWRVHLNGDKLDNRSCNIGYMTPKDIAIKRENKEWDETVSKHSEKLRSLNVDNESTEDHLDVTSDMERDQHQPTPRTGWHKGQKNPCRWCGVFVDPPNEYHPTCLQVKQRMEKH